MHIIKRLALGVPALILISSVVFFLSKMLPGNAGIHLLEDNMRLETQAQVEVRERIYNEYMARTGQDMPFFYLSLSSLAEPDTLYRIVPVFHQSFLQQLCFQYGNWPAIKDYYGALIKFQKAENVFLRNSARTGPPIVYSKLLFEESAEASIALILQKTEKSIGASNNFNEPYKDSFYSLRAKYLTMKSSQNPYLKFVPTVSWNGWENQYHQWLTNLLKGDMGVSLRNQRPVTDNIGEALGVTLMMTIASLVLGWLLSFVIAIFINLPVGAALERPILSFLYFLDTLPLFLISFLLLLTFSSSNFSGILPSFGLGNYELIDSPFLRFFELLKHLILPIFCMTLVSLPYLVGQINRAIKETQKLEFVQTARAKGVSDQVVLYKHIVRNAFLPLITVFTENLPSLIGGALVVEVVFAIPGMGRLLIGAVNGRDYTIVLGVVVLVAIVKILSNILADILYLFSDPRIKLQQ